MSTEYTVHDKDGLKIELCEHSNVFSTSITLDRNKPGQIRIDESDDTRWANEVMIYTPTLSPVDVVRMALEMLQVASYWMDSDEFEEAVKQWRGSPLDYKATLLRSLGVAGGVI